MTNILYSDMSSHVWFKKKRIYQEEICYFHYNKHVLPLSSRTVSKSSVNSFWSGRMQWESITDYLMLAIQESPSFILINVMPVSNTMNN